MKLVVLAAGEGMRMRPLTLTTPKPLLKFGGKTSLDHLFEALPEEITEAVIVVNYLAEQIKAHCGEEFHGRKITYVEGSKDGNAVGLLRAKGLFAPKERLAISYGDEVITKSEIEECLARQFSWLCYHMDEPKGVGVARVDNERRIIEVLEKPEIPPSTIVANGFMVADADIFDYTPAQNKNGEYYASSLMNEFCKNHEVYAVLGPKGHAQMSTPEDLARLDALFTKKYFAPMIVVRAPLRISFAGGGTDLPAFYRTHPGRVLSATIDKYVYLVIKSTPLVDSFIVKYQKTEIVAHPKELEHDRVREALLKLDLVHQGIEIGSFADLPAKTGLGSSSSFSVALLKGLFAFNGEKLSKENAAAFASDLEITMLGEPIGKQDQYAAAYGGFNKFQFNADESVDVEPLLIDYKTRASLEDHMLLFFTGITRDASSVLGEQNKKVADHFETYKKMADSVPLFEEKLLAGDIKGLAEMMLEGWKMKKSLASNVSNSTIDQLFEAGVNSGAWGGKILGAGGGGCLLFLASPEKHVAIRETVANTAKKNNLSSFQEVPVRFTQSGADVIFNSYNPSLY